MSNKPFLLFHAPIGTRSGYGDHARDLCRILIEEDKYDIKIADLRWGGTPRNALTVENAEHNIFLERLLKGEQLNRVPDLHIQLTVPSEFQFLGRYNIGVTAGIETTIASAEWIKGLNMMNLNIVPSVHAKNIFQSSTFVRKNPQGQIEEEIKLRKPIEVLFEGVRTEIFKKTNVLPESIVNEMKNVKDSFNFLFIGHWLKGDMGQDRKDVGMLVKVFLETFKNVKNPPGLILKTSGATFSKLDRRETLAKLNAIKRSVVGGLYQPNVYLIHGQLTDEEMNALYNHPKVKAHITFTKGEGFGRPLLEASLSAKPIIASGWSGQLDFLPKELAILLPGQLTEVHQSAAWDNIILKEAKWFTPNYNYAAQVIRDVFEHYKKYQTNAVKLAAINESKFSFEKMRKGFLEILDNYVPKFATQFSVNLPGLPEIPKLNKMEEPKEITLPKLNRLDDVKEPDAGSSIGSKEEKENIKTTEELSTLGGENSSPNSAEK
jgi:hypothetical protein